MQICDTKIEFKLDVACRRLNRHFDVKVLHVTQPPLATRTCPVSSASAAGAFSDLTASRSFRARSGASSTLSSRAAMVCCSGKCRDNQPNVGNVRWSHCRICLTSRRLFKVLGELVCHYVVVEKRTVDDRLRSDDGKACRSYQVLWCNSHAGKTRRFGRTVLTRMSAVWTRQRALPGAFVAAKSLGGASTPGSTTAVRSRYRTSLPFEGSQERAFTSVTSPNRTTSQHAGIVPRPGASFQPDAKARSRVPVRVGARP